MAESLLELENCCCLSLELSTAGRSGESFPRRGEHSRYQQQTRVVEPGRVRVFGAIWSRVQWPASCSKEGGSEVTQPLCRQIAKWGQEASKLTGLKIEHRVDMPKFNIFIVSSHRDDSSSTSCRRRQRCGTVLRLSMMLQTLRLPLSSHFENCETSLGNRSMPRATSFCNFRKHHSQHIMRTCN